MSLIQIIFKKLKRKEKTNAMVDGFHFPFSVIYQITKWKSTVKWKY